MASAAEQLAANMSLSAFRTADELKKRIWFTLGALLVYRLGTYIPLPGIDPQALQAVFSQQQSGIVGMFNMFAGGAVGAHGDFCFEYHALHHGIDCYPVAQFNRAAPPAAQKRG